MKGRLQRMKPDPAIVVAMATFRRIERLPAALACLIAQSSTVNPPARVLVIDNDPSASARSVVEQWADRGVRYVHEPTPGIAAARNRALSEAQDADALVFIDDDELPDRGWLKQLVNAWTRTGSAAVAGPVQARFLSTPSKWVIDSGAFETVVRPTGRLLQAAATNNLLLDLHQLRVNHLSFDNKFGLSGGSDGMLTHRMVSLGMEIRWCAEALVFEDVPPSRINRQWILRRTTRTSNAWTRVKITLAQTRWERLRWRAEILMRAAYRAARGVASVCIGVVKHATPARAKGECDIASAYGMLTAVAGWKVYEYRR